MPQPNLIHPVPVVVEQIDRVGTVVDDDTREPIQHAARRTPIEVSGQPNNSLRTLILSQGRGGGRNEEEDGYVLFRIVDLASKGLVDEEGNILLQTNDKIIKVGTIVSDLYVEHLEFLGFYSDISGPTLVKAFCQDRKPAKKRGA